MTRLFHPVTLLVALIAIVVRFAVDGLHVTPEAHVLWYGESEHLVAYMDSYLLAILSFSGLGITSAVFRGMQTPPRLSRAATWLYVLAFLILGPYGFFRGIIILLPF